MCCNNPRDENIVLAKIFENIASKAGCFRSSGWSIYYVNHITQYFRWSGCKKTILVVLRKPLLRSLAYNSDKYRQIYCNLSSPSLSGTCDSKTRLFLTALLSLIALWVPALSNLSFVFFFLPFLTFSCLVATIFVNYERVIFFHSTTHKLDSIFSKEASSTERGNGKYRKYKKICCRYILRVSGVFVLFLPQILSYAATAITEVTTPIDGLSVYTLTILFRLNSSLNPIRYNGRSANYTSRRQLREFTQEKGDKCMCSWVKHKIGAH